MFVAPFALVFVALLILPLVYAFYLSLYSKGLATGVVFADAVADDVVIVDDITPFFEQPGDFLIIHDWKRPWRITGNSSVYRFELGKHPEVLERFRAEHAAIRARLRNEQAWLSEAMHAQGKLSYWPAAWCASSAAAT